MTTLKHASSERCQRLLQATTRVAKAVASILDIDELLRRVVEIVGAELGYACASLYLLDQAGQWAIPKTVHPEDSASLPEEAQKLAVGGNTLVGLVTRLREARVVADLEAEEAVRNPHLHRPDSRSEAAWPLLVGDEVLGALAVQSTVAGAFTQEEVASLQAIADQVALAVKGAHVQRVNQDLVRRAERRAQLFQAASQVGQQVASILDLDRLLPHTVDIICEAYGFYYAGVFLIDETGRWAVLRAGHGEAGAAMFARGHKLEVGGLSMIGMATRLREARIALDVGTERVHFKNPLLPHTRSEMALPLAVGDKVLGALTIQSGEERAFSADDILTLQTMADHLAIAINNAMLLQELDRAHRELLQTKTYEALSAATTQAIHWIGNKALPMAATLARLQAEAMEGPVEAVSLREDLDVLAESTRQIVAVKEQLLGPAREQRPRPALLDDVVLAAAFQAGGPAVNLSLQVAPNTPLVQADTTQLTRALANLFQNALEASARQLAVTIGPDEGGVTLSLTDDGAGIPPEMLGTIWAAFVTTKQLPHIGLGLAACLHVISQHHGRMAVTSEPDRGTTFKVWLPVPPAEAGAENHTEFIGPPVNILIIDDDDPWARFAMQALARAGKRVACTATLDGAAEADLILLDEALRAGRVADILRALAASNLVGKVVVVTAALTVERTTAYLQAGVKDVALKPYTPSELTALLRG